MSDQIPTGADLFARPTEIDEGSYLRIRQIRPVERAAAPIVDHNIVLIETALALRPWYRGESAATPRDYLSDLLDPHDNNAVVTLADFTKTVKAFPPGAFPAHCHAVRTLAFTTKHLIATLGTLVDSSVFNNALRCLGLFFAAISDPANLALPRHDFELRVDAKLEKLVESFRAISREFGIRERTIAFNALQEPPAHDDAKADEILSAVKETRQIVKRIDARDVKRGKREREIDRQEKCYGYWMSGNRMDCIKSKSKNGRATYEAVFDYYRRELQTIDVTTPALFATLLTRRSKRLSRTQTT